LATPRGFEPL